MDKRPRDLMARSLRFADGIIDFVEREQQRRHLLALRARALQEAEECQYWLMVIQRRRNSHSEPVVADLLAQVSELVAILKVCVRKLRGQ